MRRVPTLLMALLMLAGCAVVVPTSGPVEHHAPQQQQANPGVEIAPVPPAAGASPSLIIEGFLHAMATYQRDYQVARQFLTGPANETWRPESGVEVYAEGFPPAVTENSAVITAPLVGSLDLNGSFSPAQTAYHHDFGLIRDEQGQWRISKPPRGLLISQYLFASTFVRTTLCFWNPTQSWMVPDPRFYPKGQRALSAAVAGVLNGPSLWLAPAVRPQGQERYAADSVSLDARGVVAVRVRQAATPSAEVRNRILAELAWSLDGVEGVTGVEVGSTSGELWLRGGDPTVTTDDFAEVGPLRTNQSTQLYALVRGNLARVQSTAPDGEVAQVALGLLRANSFAVRYDGELFAAVTDNRTRLRTGPPGDGPAKLELSGRGLLRPQFSRTGELWTGSDQPGQARLQAVSGGKRVPIATDELPAGGIRAFRLAPDAARIALIVDDQGVSRLGVARVIRADGRIRVEQWRTVGVANSADPLQYLDVGWSSTGSLLALASSQQATRVLLLDSEGAEAHDVGPGDSTTWGSLAVTPLTAGVAVSSDGNAFRFFDEFTWGLILADVQAVGYPE